MQRSIYYVMVCVFFSASVVAKRAPTLEWEGVMQHVRHKTALNLKDMAVAVQGARRLTPQKLPPFMAPLVGQGAVFHKHLAAYDIYAWAPLSKLPPLFGDMRHHPVQRLGPATLWTLDLEFETLRLFIIKGGVIQRPTVEGFGPLNPSAEMMDREKVQALKKARRQAELRAKRPAQSPAPKPTPIQPPKPALTQPPKPAPAPPRVSTAAQLSAFTEELAVFQRRFVLEEADWKHPLIKSHLRRYIGKIEPLLAPSSPTRRALKRLSTSHQEIKERMQDLHQALEDSQIQARKMSERARRHQARILDEARPIHRRVAHQESLDYYQHALREKSKEFRALKAHYMRLKRERALFYKKALALLIGREIPSK